MSDPQDRILVVFEGTPEDLAALLEQGYAGELWCDLEDAIRAALDRKPGEVFEAEVEDVIGAPAVLLPYPPSWKIGERILVVRVPEGK